jgi:hypothetical protein
MNTLSKRNIHITVKTERYIDIQRPFVPMNCYIGEISNLHLVFLCVDLVHYKIIELQWRQFRHMQSHCRMSSLLLAIYCLNQINEITL